jgi:hypothetical protein
MTELAEQITDGRPPANISSDWLTGGTKAPDVAKDATDGAKILGRLRTILEQKFQLAAKTEYDVNATERERAFESGYRKALKDVYRLLQLDN